LMDDDNNFVEIAQVELPVYFDYGNIFFYNNTAYIIYIDNLAIVENINNENICFSNDISIPTISSKIYFYQDFMFICNTHQGNSYIYNLDNPINPVLELTIENSGIIGIDYDNDLLFMGTYLCEVYDLSTINSGIINQIDSFRNWSNCCKIIPFERNENNYLIYLEDTSCSIYQYNNVSKSEDIEILSITPSLTNHPNPFNPSGAGRSPATTISFNLTAEDAENAELIIYNIKGQKVKQLISNSASQLSAGQHSVVWDGRDENGKPVSSGVYFYKLKTGKQELTRKMLLLK
ncbi:MAG: T9SS type A sorting domain-containing protein, partial [Candidatus Cloacimonetes bacterium]|nr:T9SS type A sorting domain-containing protein [Candidatus Cloacimonadota bacterium]